MSYFSKFILTSSLLLLSFFANAQNQPLLESPQLAEILSQVQPVDIRSPELYQAGHIPGAISVPYGRWRGPAHNPGQLSDEATFTALVRELGLEYDQHLVIYSTGDDVTDFGAAARVYWTLKYLGFPTISVLNGGYQHWQNAAERPVSQESSTLPSGQINLQLQPGLAVGTDELLEKVTSGQDNYLLLDSRPVTFYQGQMKAPTASTGGTIAGARNAPHQQWFNPDDTRIRPAEEIRRMVQEQGLDQAQETLSFCNTGHWAATNWFVLSELAGIDHVRLYPGSMAEWTQHPQELPMDNAPGRLQQIKNKFQQLLK